MARKFLYIVAALIVLVIAAGLIWQYAGSWVMQRAFVPSARFTAAPAESVQAYDDPAMWYARPDKSDDPSRWTPAGYAPAPHPAAALFFIAPTSYLARDAWNMPLDNAEANDRARLFVRGETSAFKEAAEIWAPRYRQATFGAFLTRREDAQKALDLAYRDVLAAFEAFLRAQPADRPIILAGHSQGALHLTRLLKERIAGTPLAKRIVAAYVAGWPISVETDLGALGLPACEHAAQAGCILSWQSFAEPADPKLILDTYDATTGFNGQPRKGTDLLCVNPLTGTRNGAAPASANLGTLLPTADFATAAIMPGLVPARCGGRGLLLIGGNPPALGPYVLPGNNYHVYDYALFWANIRADAKARLGAFEAGANP